MVVIDPGHGGPDSGAVGIGGLRETDVVLDISRTVARYLGDKGVKVLMTRSNEIEVGLNQRVLMSNLQLLLIQQKCQQANSLM